MTGHGTILLVINDLHRQIILRTVFVRLPQQKT